MQLQPWGSKMLKKEGSKKFNLKIRQIAEVLDCFGLDLGAQSMFLRH